ncbi:F-box domain [Arabidopsis suecica]|uniref:F-box domain n=1 Tax=Arabidopsis suecica TaxID=45249 RepID=A0A8T2H7I5_ARASU|nr:F-box domain [Arabidopsis suecica]
MNRAENLDSIPTDLILEIFSRMSTKSIGRCRCVSKLWKSMLGHPYFTELFLTRSSDHPRLLFGVKRERQWLFFSSPQPQDLYEKSSLVDFHMNFSDFHMNFSGDIRRNECTYVSGFIYFPRMRIKNYLCDFRVICNPITGQYAILQLITFHEKRSFLGFDPIDKQFKVLRMKYNDRGIVVHHILTLEPGKMRWRKIRCPLAHEPFWEEICANGVLYYLAEPTDGGSYVICCFDVRSEKFKFIDAKCFGDFSIQLINYKGKLGGISWKYDTVDGKRTVELYMWVLEDVEKQKWSKYVYPLPGNSYHYSVAGVTAKGDIVFVKTYTSKPFYVFYVNPEKKTFQRVEIHGNHEVFDTNNLVYAFVDHVEDLKFDVMKKTYAAKPISRPKQKPNPPSTETSSREDHQGWISISSRKYHQVRTIAHRQQGRRKFESINKFNALYLDDGDEDTVAHQQRDHHTFKSISKFKAQGLLDDDEFTGVKTSKCDTSHLQVSCELSPLCWLSILLFLVMMVYMSFMLQHL